VKNQETISKNTGNDFNDPTLSIVIDKLAGSCRTPDFGEEIGRAITMDQALASKVLQVGKLGVLRVPRQDRHYHPRGGHPGFFNGKKHSPHGVDFLMRFSNRKNSRSEFSMENFWMHSIACGAASQTIAKHIGFKEKEECFIAGLIHDIGKIILCHYFPDEFEHVFQKRPAKRAAF